jgi:uncharacterized protein (DUF2237 family)
MEVKKIKKLVLKKEVIASLSDHDQNNVRGGTMSTLCVTPVTGLTIIGSCNGGGGGATLADGCYA